MSERAQGFASGVILGLLVVLIVLSIIACQSARGGTGSTWSIVQPGTTVVQTPCGLIVIEIRANTDRSVFYWRIVLVPKVIPIPPKPERVPPSA